jgi:hypothetical protein
VRIPSWLDLTLLGLAAYRTWKLAGEDTITVPLRSRLAAPIQEFLGCPWCSGFWIALAWWSAWQIWPHGTLVAAGAMALSALVGIIGYFT